MTAFYFLIHVYLNHKDMQIIELNIKSNQLLLSYTFFSTKIKKYFNNVKIGALCTSIHQSNRMSVSLYVCIIIYNNNNNLFDQKIHSKQNTLYALSVKNVISQEMEKR